MYAVVAHALHGHSSADLLIPGSPVTLEPAVCERRPETTGFPSQGETDTTGTVGPGAFPLPLPGFTTMKILCRRSSVG